MSLDGIHHVTAITAEEVLEPVRSPRTLVGPTAGPDR
jgi:hypothetical protein